MDNLTNDADSQDDDLMYHDYDSIDFHFSEIDRHRSGNILRNHLNFQNILDQFFPDIYLHQDNYAPPNLYTEIKNDLSDSQFITAKMNQAQLKVIEEQKCSICISVLRDPIILPCKHIFCQNCLDLNFKAHNYSCPLCRGMINLIFAKNLSQHKDIYASLKISSLPIKCIYPECTWEGNQQTSMLHLGYCKYNKSYYNCTRCNQQVDINKLADHSDLHAQETLSEELTSCKFCSCELYSNDLYEHMLKRCPKTRTVKCQQCNQSFPYAEIKNHEIQCQKYKCSLCNDKQLRNMKQHLDHESNGCPYKTKLCNKCKYLYFECNEFIHSQHNHNFQITEEYLRNRKNYDNHYKLYIKAEQFDEQQMQTIIQQFGNCLVESKNGEYFIVNCYNINLYLNLFLEFRLLQRVHINRFESKLYNKINNQRKIYISIKYMNEVIRNNLKDILEQEIDLVSSIKQLKNYQNQFIVEFLYPLKCINKLRFGNQKSYNLGPIFIDEYKLFGILPISQQKPKKMYNNYANNQQAKFNQTYNDNYNNYNDDF